MYFMSIDAGTGSVRAVIFDDRLNQIGLSQQEWSHISDPKYPGSMGFDIENNYSLILQCIKNSIKNANINPKEIVAISTTSMREGIVLYDSSGKELWACANVDSRAYKEVETLKLLGENIEYDLYSISGQTFALGALPRVLWVKNNFPDIYEKISFITMLNDWIIYKLTNVLSIEPSNGCTTGMFNLKNRQWDSSIASKCGIKDNIYPEVFESGSVVGKVISSLCDEIGLSNKCLVVTGGGDAQLGCLGVGSVNKGQAALFGGSFWQLEYNYDAPIIDEKARIRVNCHVIPSIWQQELIAFFPGLILRWFRDAFCDLEKLVEKQTGIDAYYLLEKQAQQVPVGANGLMGIFSDKMNYISWKHAAPSFLNFSIDPEKFDKKVFYRSILENAALVTLGNMKILESSIGDAPDEIIFASGASKSDLWCQIISDTLGVKLKVPRVKEATALGAAICAGMGVRAFDSMEEAVLNFVKIEKEYIPNKNNHDIYQEIYNKWETIYPNQLSLADKGVLTHMWKAPGV